MAKKEPGEILSSCSGGSLPGLNSCHLPSGPAALIPYAPPTAAGCSVSRGPAVSQSSVRPQNRPSYGPSESATAQQRFGRPAVRDASGCCRRITRPSVALKHESRCLFLLAIVIFCTISIDYYGKGKNRTLFSRYFHYLEENFWKNSGAFLSKNYISCEKGEVRKDF